MPGTKLMASGYWWLGISKYDIRGWAAGRIESSTLAPYFAILLAQIKFGDLIGGQLSGEPG